MKIIMTIREISVFFGAIDYVRVYRAYSSSLLRAIITCNPLLFFKIFSKFVYFCPNFEIFCPFSTFLCPFSEISHPYPYFLE